MVIGVLFINNREEKTSTGEKEVVKIGILQFVTHDALDEIEKGIEDGLADAGHDDKPINTFGNREKPQKKNFDGFKV